jgi:prephenate dehydratase
MLVIIIFSLFSLYITVSCLNLVLIQNIFQKTSLKRKSSLRMVTSTPYSVRVAYQGEPGAYSEKAARELLGSRVTTVNYESFEDTFKAVALKEVDYAVVPIENSLGGSIHTNFDLLLRYDLHVIGEHEFRVEHSLLALPGVKKEDIKKIMSHPQALAQCDNYIRQLGVHREATYDTAGSAKMIKEKNLKDCAAIASDLAGLTYGLDVLESNIEDHDNNFTRFLLLSRQSVSAIIPPSMPAKTSIVFLLPNNPGALYKALACFSLRDIDFCKIESRPTSVQLLQSLRLKERKSQGRELTEGVYSGQDDLPRFQYTFYLDFLASELDDRTQNALAHLKEQSKFVRVLGSYPRGATGAKGSETLIGPIRIALATLSKIPITTEYPSSPIALNGLRKIDPPMKLGIIGFGKFGQFLAKTFVKQNEVYCMSKEDKSVIAKELKVKYVPLFDAKAFAKVDCDILIISVSIISFEEVIRSLPRELLKGKLVVDVLSVKVVR